MPITDERALIEKLLRIEALHAGATTPGERAAAANAMDRIRERLQKVAVQDPPVEYRFSMADPWARKLFLALLRRYELRPYRYPRQRYTTVMVRVPRRFVDETLWPEYLALSESLRAYLNEVTERVISEAGPQGPLGGRRDARARGAERAGRGLTATGGTGTCRASGVGPAR